MVPVFYIAHPITLLHGHRLTSFASIATTTFRQRALFITCSLTTNALITTTSFRRLVVLGLLLLLLVVLIFLILVITVLVLLLVLLLGLLVLLQLAIQGCLLALAFLLRHHGGLDLLQSLEAAILIVVLQCGEGVLGGLDVHLGLIFQVDARRLHGLGQRRELSVVEFGLLVGGCLLGGTPGGSRGVLLILLVIVPGQLAHSLHLHGRCHDQLLLPALLLL
mmetsp:Transcript_12774/g.32801  ORF Transcript_12774/g.32801 Transcript_12774/m.32801 type:complete len:221 (-) Transcript_12774:257-919(-)